MLRTPVIVTLSLLLLIVAAWAWAVQIDGQVVNDDGAPQSDVKVEFFGDNLYSAWTDENGSFSIADVAPGDYKVKVTGPRQQTIDVKVDSAGMHPNPLVVDW